MDIGEHLAQHEDVLKALAFQYGRYDRDLREDCYQAGILALIEAHARWGYHGAELLTYAWYDVKKAMLKQVRLVKTEYRYGITEELDELQEIAEEQGRDRLRLDSLYGEPIVGIQQITESSISSEDLKLALVARTTLSEDDLRLLDASSDRSNYSAARALGLPESTFRYRLKRAIRRAKALVD